MARYWREHKMERQTRKGLAGSQELKRIIMCHSNSSQEIWKHAFKQKCMNAQSSSLCSSQKVKRHSFLSTDGQINRVWPYNSMLIVRSRILCLLFSPPHQPPHRLSTTLSPSLSQPPSLSLPLTTESCCDLEALTKTWNFFLCFATVQKFSFLVPRPKTALDCDSYLASVSTLTHGIEAR